MKIHIFVLTSDFLYYFGIVHSEKFVRLDKKMEFLRGNKQ